MLTVLFPRNLELVLRSTSESTQMHIASSLRPLSSTSTSTAIVPYTGKGSAEIIVPLKRCVRVRVCVPLCPLSVCSSVSVVRVFLCVHCPWMYVCPLSAYVCPLSVYLVSKRILCIFHSYLLPHNWFLRFLFSSSSLHLLAISSIGISGNKNWKKGKVNLISPLLPPCFHASFHFSFHFSFHCSFHSSFHISFHSSFPIFFRFSFVLLISSRRVIVA